MRRWPRRRSIVLVSVTVLLINLLSSGVQAAAPPVPPFVPKGPNEPVANLPLSFPTLMSAAPSKSAHLEPPSIPPAPPATAALAPQPPHIVKQTYTPTLSTATYSDGSTRVDYYIVPVKRDLGGTWSSVDPTVASTGISQQPLAAQGALRPVKFGSSSSQILELDFDGGKVAMSASALRVGQPSLQADGEVLYASVATDTDLTYLVGYGGVKEKILLKSSAAPTQFTFHISDPYGQLGSAHLQSDGSYLFDARIDSTVAVGLAPAYAYQQSDTGGGAQHLPGTAQITATRAGDGFDVTTSVNPTWLAGKKFPIVLDPTLTFTDTSGTMATYTDYNTTNGPGTNKPQTGNDLWAGTFTYPNPQNPTVDYNPSRTFFSFNLSSIPTGSLITYATLNMNVSGCVALGSTCAAQSSYNLDLHRLTGSWDSNSTWNQLSSLTASGAFASISESGSRIANATSSNTFWETWEVSQQVQRWVNGAGGGGDTNYGFEAQIRTETTNIGGPYWCYQRTTYCVNQNTHPYLSVAYTTPTSTAGDQSATVNWSFSGDPSYANTYTVTSLDNTTGLSGPTVIAAGTSTSAVFGPPNSTLTNTQTYSFKITGNFPWTGTGTNPGPASVSAGSVTLPLAITSAVSPVGELSLGEQATYTLTVSNNTSSPLSVTSISDTLQTAFQPSSAPVTIDGNPCTTSPTCSISNGTLSIGAFTLAANSSHAFTYTGIELGSARGCLSAANAVATVDAYGTSHASTPELICDGGLGSAIWWSFVDRAIGPGGTASINVADGDLMISQADATPIPGHGGLSFGLERVYNSQDTGNLTISSGLGSGWRLTAGVAGPIALYNPSPTTQVAYPTGVVLIESTGLRDVFLPRGGTFTAVDVTSRTLSGSLAALNPRALPALDSGYTKLCVDTSFVTPPGAHYGLWRYSEVNGSTCTSYSTAKVFGFAAMSVDRMRFEFSADGRLLDTSDPAGNELLYAYDGQNRVLNVSEPRCQAPNKCRSFAFSYLTNETDVTDPAGRVTKYKFTSGLLTQVVNPDSSASTLNYAYGSCTGATANQLCSTTDPNGGTTSLTYTPAYVSGGLPRVATLTDRRSNQTTLTYYNTASPEYVTSDVSNGGHRALYKTIDGSGRVSEIDEGDTSNNVLRQTLVTWDASGQTCRQPDSVVDNDICQVVRRTTPGSSSASDETTAYVYNPEGRLIIDSQTVSSGLLATTTSGYHAEYFETGGTARIFNDTVSGGGAVASDSGPRADSQTVFFTSDQTQLLSPNGNAIGPHFSAYQTTYQVDNSTSASPDSRPSGTVCPSSGTNTGLVCEVDGPYYDSTSQSARTTYTYDVYGQKTSMKTPKANAEGGNAYSYTYYDDSANDLSGAVSAGGWLKATADPTGNFTVIAYDPAGNPSRTWDANSTAKAGVPIANYPGGTGVPVTYDADSYTPTGGKPWRYLLSASDQLGDTTTYTLDKNGNQTTIRPPRGNQAGNSSYDITQTFDASDNRLTLTMPMESGHPTQYTYDAYDNLVEVQDPGGKVAVNMYDSVSRLVTTRWTRGVWNAATAPAGCRQSTTSDAPLPSGDILCFTSLAYDGTDNLISSSDGNGQTTTIAFDSKHQERTRQIPRNSGGTTTVRLDHTYDLDGNVLDTCPPREFSPSEGNSSNCTSAGYYSTHQSWDSSDRLSTVTTYRTSGGSANVATYTYDADGNPKTYTDADGHVTTYTYDLLNRRTSAQATGQSGSYTITYNYDANGNQTAVTRPITSTTSQITAYSYDTANRLVDTVVASNNVDATQAGAPDAAGGINIRTRQAYDADGHVVAVFPPDAFGTSWTPGSAPDARFMVRTDYDFDGRISAQYQPRYDSSTYSDLGGTYGSTSQTTQCSTTPANPPATISGIPTYPSGVGLCYERKTYDLDGRVLNDYLPTYNGGNTGRVLSYTYTDDGKVATLSGPDPSSTTSPAPAQTDFTYLYDGVGNLVKTTTNMTFQATSAYTGDNIVQQQTSQPAGSNTHQLTYTLDANGNRTFQTDQASQQIRYDYYTDNTLRDWFDAVGNETYYVLDAAGNVLDVYPPAINVSPFDANNSGGTPTIISYTPDNLPSQVVEPVRPDGTLRRTTTYTYDLMGRRTQTTVQLANYSAGGPSGSRTSWNGSATSQSLTYLPDSRISVQTGRNNETISQTYDPAGNVLSATETGNTTSTSTDTFYLDSRPRTVDDGTITSQYAYDGSGSVALSAQVMDGVSPPNNFYSHLYSYTDAGQLSKLSSSLMPSGQYVQRFYDHDGRLNQENYPNGYPNGAQASWTWNNDDTLATVKLTNSGGQYVGIYTYNYDSTRRILSQVLTNTGTSADGTFSYQYDAASRLTSFTDTNNVQKTITWSHDGNRLTFGSQSFTYNADDSMAANDSAGYSYNAQGELTSDGCMAYSYDGFDRLSQVSQTGSCQLNTVTYSYDSFDRQTSRSWSSGSTQFHYDGLGSGQVLERTTGLADTVYDNIGSLSVAVNQGSLPLNSVNTQYLLDDGHGDAGMVTNSNSTTVCDARFDPWGVPYGSGTSYAQPCSGGAGTIDKHFYRNGRLDETTGNYQLGSRTYAPLQAGFLEADTYRTGTAAAALSVTKDPITRNRYSYVNGDPVNEYDPSGHDGTCGATTISFGLAVLGANLMTSCPTNTTFRTSGNTSGLQGLSQLSGTTSTLPLPSNVIDTGQQRSELDGVDQSAIASPAPTPSTPATTRSSTEYLPSSYRPPPQPSVEPPVNEASMGNPFAFAQPLVAEPPPWNGGCFSSPTTQRVCNDIARTQATGLYACVSNLKCAAFMVVAAVALLVAGAAIDGIFADASAAEEDAGAIAPRAMSSVATEPDQAYFWSGRTNGVGGELVARQLAASRGGTTLEQLIEDRNIQMPAYDASDPASVKAWTNLSREYAANASGDVNAVIGQTLRPGNIWEEVELPTLLRNPAVRSITTIDPATLEERLLFERAAA